MRPLFLTAENRAKATALKDFASRPENRYRPMEKPFVPGDHAEYVAILDSFRCVFTLTEVKGKVFRHLSISVPGGAFPGVPHAMVLADWFGFTGVNDAVVMAAKVPSTWNVGIDEDHRAVLIVEELIPQPSAGD